ncbi:ABC transporter [Micrococcus luteus]|uniref:ABC-type cobalamin/Fe3+-siderophore transport system, ATPase component n=1 Tax=Micrococcus luteus (strain ATCC 4698 / DSM 20030 / JCM 1464 / CCM 169 / CCUG 5858 / IAM 1056 / NBRC 3333 / NCIMB 9278 / NCTC 2665 / VKM Ac-2230) TaxID=465515 RepID=C5C7J1_MICLC|nr:ABC transporter ATP-binding protein [Micrococcus luteus]ACS31679.1 ABC-type cobalamin/Fe3+-siderophore transport system, ATPase component [Micrococcus luteus NCTC 2665]AJO56727.1 ABC transporter [Micrococcus luteus]KAB1900644.1 ABC transporter ATP-binding protein [Micrococcus luteus NCTC 2665]ORE60954.1 ABC transporter [Micrococcus luteus]QCY44514.1 ABC transporter ATP-binding protein [Micrococcus luteus]
MTAPPLTVPSPAAPRTGAADDVAIRLRGLTLGYGPASAPPIVEDLDLDVPAGRVTAIIGANGCGKSTLLRGLTRQLAPRAGSIEVLGRDAARVSARDYARTVALLPQHPVAPEGMTVAQLVARGRHPHRGLLGGRAAGDDAAIASALERTGLVELAEREAGTLSGGQRQRAWLALVLAQQTPVVLLDEPTSYLDLSHQVEVLDLVRALPDPRGGGRATVVAVLHELNLAARSADHIVAMAAGRVVAQGTPGEVIVPEVLAEVFGLDADVVADPLLGHPVVLPRGNGDRR